MAGFYKSLLVRVVQEDLKVVDSGNRAQILVSITKEGRRLLIEVQADRFQAARRVSAKNDNLVRLHLRLVHHSIELIRQAQAFLTEKWMQERRLVQEARQLQAEQERLDRQQSDQQVQERSIEAKVEPASFQAEPIRTASAWRIGVSLSSVCVWNPGHVGLFSALGYRLSIEDKWFAFLNLGILTPFSQADAIDIVEWGSSLGAGHRFVLLPERLYFDVQLLIGFLHHTYRYRDPGEFDDLGDRLDLVITFRSAFVYRVSKHLELQGVTGVLIDPIERVHKVGTKELWRSTIVRALLGINLTYRFGV